MANYCCADLHGNYTIWNKIKSTLTEDDTLYILGDVIDRGAGGIQILKEIMADSRMRMLKGNHEDMMYWACSGDDPEHLEQDIEDWFKNGGGVTAEAYNQLAPEEQDEILAFINYLPSLYVYQNAHHEKFYLTHAGFTPPVDISPDAAWKLYWGREHLDDPYKEEQWLDDLTYVVHGHTPVQLQNSFYMGAPRVYPYCNGRKINLDLGTPWTETAALFNLDDWSVKYFYAIDPE